MVIQLLVEFAWLLIMAEKRKKVVLLLKEKSEITDALKKDESRIYVAEKYGVEKPTKSEMRKKSGKIGEFFEQWTEEEGSLERKIMRKS